MTDAELIVFYKTEMEYCQSIYDVVGWLDAKKKLAEELQGKDGDKGKETGKKIVFPKKEPPKEEKK